MADLIASSVGVSFGVRELFADVAVTIDPGDRIALVGPNGAGKTTLLRVLSGQLNPTTGEVRVPDHLHVALHDQRPERSALTLDEYASPPRMVAFEARLRELELAMASGDEAVFREYDDVRGRFDAVGGETWHTRMEQVLRGLGFREDQRAQRLDTLSGGELTRASLARALASGPDLLLLDEPTNHLDIEAIEWLQSFLNDLPGGVVIVSHDRWFIESIANGVIEIADGRARRFKGGFVEYRAQQALEAITAQSHIERWQTEMARLQRFVDRFQAGTRSRQATARVKMMDKLRADTPQFADMRSRRTISFSLPVPERSGQTVLDVRGLEMGFGGAAGRTLLKPVSFTVERGEKIALLGRNGTGKSTFMQALIGACLTYEDSPDALQAGEIRVGYNTTARHLSQHDAELKDELSMIGNVMLDSPTSVGKSQALSLLGLFGFTGSDGERRTGDLSGGERRRLLLAKALTGSANLLLLDEPTNHLDIEGREALESALSEFDGTVILISHDRALVEGVATRTVVLHEQTLTTIVGGYTQARAVLAGEEPLPSAGWNAAEAAAVANVRAAAVAVPERTKRRERPAKPEPKRAPTVAEAKPAGRTVTRPRDGERPGRVKRSGGAKRVRRPATVEGEIEASETELAEVQQLMLDPDVYTSPEKSSAALERHTTLERRIARLYDELESSTEHFGS